MAKTALVAVCASMLCLALASPLRAQTQTGTIEGTVKGPDGALLPGVTVTVSGASLMGTRTAVTGDLGFFRFLSLLPGDDYVVEFALANFRGTRYEHVVVQVGQTSSLMVTLEIAGVSTSVTVVSRSPVVDIVSPVTSTHVGGDLLAVIPNIQREWGQTVLQTPGVVDGTNENYNGILYSARGGSTIVNQSAVDGVTNSAPLQNLVQGSGTVFEAIQEVQVVTGALPAEIGNLGGAYINVVTKSGGNVVRGEGGVYFEGDSLQSDNVDDELSAAGLKVAKISEFHDVGLNLGGPIRKDRVWFDVALADRNLGVDVSGFEFPDSKRDKYYSGKVTWQAAPSHTVTGLLNYGSWDIPYTGGSAFITPEATVQSLFKTWNYKAKWTGAITPKLLAEVDLGIRSSDQANAPNAGAGAAYLDAVTGVISGGNLTYFDIDYLRVLPRASFSWFEPDLQGSHQFKVGLEFEQSTGDIRRYSTSPLFFHYMVAGSPTLAFFWNQADGVVSKYAMRGVHVFAQDSWSVSRRVTLGLGVRVNTWRGSWPVQSNDGFSYGTAVSFPAVAVTSDTTAASWSPAEPRIAATIALDERAKTLLRVGVSRYHHGLDMTYFQGGNPNGTALSIHPWVDFDGDRFADPNEVFGPIQVQVSGGAANPVDPDLRNPFTDEVTVGVGRELFPDASITVNATWRRDRDLIDDVNTTAATSTYVSVPLPDPGPDGVAGNADDRTFTALNQVTNLGRPNLLTVTNPEQAKRDYKSVETVFSKRMADRWQALVSLVWQSATGTLQQNRNDASGISAVFNDPNTLTNLSGPLVLDSEWQFKMMGSYVAPYDIVLGGYFLHQTGTPLYRTLNITLNQGPITVIADPRDSYREDHFSRFDLRAEKSFQFGTRRTNVSVLVDVFNLFNADAVTNRNEGTASGFRRPLAVQGPRTLRIGARLRF